MAFTLNLVGSGTTTNPVLVIQDSAITNRLSFLDNGALTHTPAVAAGTATIHTSNGGITAASGSSQTFISLLLSPTYNLTGTFTGTAIGLDYNPTLTSLTGTTHLALRATSGSVLLGGTTLTNASTLLDLQSTSMALVLTRLTSASILSKVNGMMWYDSGTNKFSFYQNGSVVNLSTASVGASGEVQTSDGSGGFISGGSSMATGGITLGLSTVSSLVQIISTTSSGTTPPALVVTTMASSTAGVFGGSVTISGGSAFAGNTNGGTLYLQGGQASGTSPAGNTVMLGASPTGTNGTGGYVQLVGGSSAGTGSAAPVFVQGGTAAGSGAGGDVELSGGLSGTGVGGHVFLSGGSATGSMSAAGNVSLRGGGSTVSTIAGGNVTITGGLAQIGNSNGGNVTITGGQASGIGTPGLLTLAGAASVTTAITAGHAKMLGGSATVGNANGGNVYLMPGSGFGTGVAGNLFLHTSSGTSSGGGVLVTFINNATTAPSTNPSGGGILYVSNTLPFWANGASRGILSTSGRTATATNYTLLVTDDIVGVTSTAAARAITLPAANSVPAGKLFSVKDESGGAATNNITISRAGADTIDGATSVVLNTNYGKTRFYSDGTSKWFTV